MREVKIHTKKEKGERGKDTYKEIEREREKDTCKEIESEREIKIHTKR